MAEAGDTTVDLLTGHPSDEILSRAVPLIANATVKWAVGGSGGSIASGGDAHAENDALLKSVSYHPDEGSLEAREAVARFVQRQLDVDRATLPDGSGVVVRGENVFLAPGCSAALDMLCTALRTRPGEPDSPSGRTVIMESPTYFLARRVFEDHGFRVVGVPVDEEGIKVGRLREMIDAGQVDAKDIRLLYTIPIHHNPTSVCMSAKRRVELVALSKEHGFYILADEVYQHLSFPGTDAAATAPLFAFDTEGPPTVVSIGSLSKIVAPALRFGWLLCRPQLWQEKLTQIGFLGSGGSLASLQANVVAHVLDDEAFSKHHMFVRESYANGSQVLVDTITTLLGDSGLATIRQPTGGYFVWIQLRDDLAVGSVVESLREAGLVVLPGHKCASNPTEESPELHAVRLCFAMRPAEQLRRGGTVLVETLIKLAADR